MGRRLLNARTAPVALFAVLAVSVLAVRGHHQGAKSDKDPILVAIGTQDTTTNTAAAGVVIRKLGLLEKYLPHDGRYAGRTISVTWQNFTSGPPITNGMMADKLQFGTMGDYPLIVNGFTFQSNPQSKSQLIAVVAYNISGSGNGVVVNKASPYYELGDLKGKIVSVPFGSAAHGMLMRALEQSGRGSKFFQLVNQSPEVGATNLQEQKIDAHADFVPFPELLAHRGFARKIFDGAETNLPTWHGIVVRTDFAKKYPEIVQAYLRALIEAEAWIKANPKRAAEKISAWTGTDKEVVYLYLGPGGIMTMDPTLKPQLLDAAKVDTKVLQSLDRIKEFDIDRWVNDSYLKSAFVASGLNYSAQIADIANYEVTGMDDYCHRLITAPRASGEIWLGKGEIQPYSSAACTLAAYEAFVAKHETVDEAYVFDHTRGIKLFAKDAYFAVSSHTDVVPFMLKRDAVAYAAKSGAKVMSFEEALKSVGTGS